MKGPEPYLHERGIRLECPVRRGRPAVVDTSTRVFLGHDLFCFSDRAARDRFLADPLRWARTLTDPVTLTRFEPTRRSPTLTWNGRRYWFRSSSTYAIFRAEPERYAVRKGA